MPGLPGEKIEKRHSTHQGEANGAPPGGRGMNGTNIPQSSSIQPLVGRSNNMPLPQQSQHVARQQSGSVYLLFNLMETYCIQQYTCPFTASWGMPQLGHGSALGLGPKLTPTGG